MEQLTTKLCDEILATLPKKENPQALPIDSLQKGSILQIDIISLEGKIFELYSRTDDVLQVQFHILFNKTVKKSPIYTLSDFSKPNTIGFSASIMDTTKFHLTTQNGNDLSSIVIYITTVPIELPEQLNNIGLDRKKSDLFAQAVLDSRLAQIFSGDFFSVEIASCQSEFLFNSEESSGIMYVRLTRSGGTRDPQFISPSESDISLAETTIQQYQAYLTRLSHENFLRLRSWWALLKKTYPFLSSRNIKLIAEDECGRHRFICHFISPIQPSRELLGPRFAARFVSLIPLKREGSLLSGGRVCRWLPAHAFLSCLQGDVESHALLLCSLLLGWGLNAFVASGCIFSSEADGDIEGEGRSAPLIPVQQIHYWVVTIEETSREVTFWESLTGEQLHIAWGPQDHENDNENEIESEGNVEGNVFNSRGKSTHYSSLHGFAMGSLNHHYREIWALFRHNELLINVQRDCSSGTSFDIKNIRCWQRFPPSLGQTGLESGFEGKASEEGRGSELLHSLSALRHPGSEIRLMNCHTSLECQDMEETIERALHDWITIRRNENGLQTHFDPSLSILLQPALVSYELDRAAGFILKNSDFSSSIQQAVLPGQCFKAFPTCFSHTHIPTITATLLNNPAARNIIFARSSLQVRPSTLSSRVAMSPFPTRLGVRVRVVPYPERLCAVWVAVAACYDGE